MGGSLTIIFQYHAMFFVQIYVWYIRTFLTQSPHSLTHSLVTETLYFFHRIYEAWAWAISIGRTRFVCRSICTQKHMYAEAYMYAHILPVEAFFASMREIRFSQTISHCTDIQPPTTKIFSNTFVIWIKTSPQCVGLVGFDFVYKCGFVEYWKIREISTSASENVDFIGSTVDYDINKIFTIDQRPNIDAL